MPEATITIDADGCVISIRRAFSASVERAWWAWTDPVALARWWGPSRWQATIHELDLRPGGRWRFELRPEDASAPGIRGVATYGVIDPLTRLSYEDAFADEHWLPDGTGTFPTEVAFAADVHGCHVDVRASFPDEASLRRAVELQMAAGYAQALERLEHVLTTP